ncbi:late embryogenesis abundant protein At3g53040-like [Telopea speciosissima]|uniref:late embryogenesis abundant protein At3g53040-like n=1 Tax=Telopea speciosissima TaxID=54955 RepID=UPI001CC3C07A|nr:late embryogenesis abundant protein At3g53040-like [Telopea speciosissima]
MGEYKDYTAQKAKEGKDSTIEKLTELKDTAVDTARRAVEMLDGKKEETKQKAEEIGEAAKVLQAVQVTSKGDSTPVSTEQEVKKATPTNPKATVTLIVEEGEEVVASLSSDPPEIEREKKMRGKVDKLEVAVKDNGKEKVEEELVFFPKGRIPDDFKWKLDKFDGSRDPKARLKIFAMVAKSWDVTENQMG